MKSISAETTFARDIAHYEGLAQALRPLCERVAQRLERSGHAAAGVTLKLKTSDFRVISRSRRLVDPTQRAQTIYGAALPLLRGAVDGTAFRLIGIGADQLAAAALADPPDLFAEIEDQQLGRGKASI
jgi:DNA polymerase-4